MAQSLRRGPHMPDSWGENWYQELVGVAVNYVLEEHNPAEIIRMMVDHYGVDIETARRAVKDAQDFLKRSRGYA